MLADFRSNAEILFLVREELRPKPVFSKSKDIFLGAGQKQGSVIASMGDVSRWGDQALRPAPLM